jgi:hypothetical protein
MPKYTTLKDLADAFKSGELDDSYSLLIDKGGVYLGLRQYDEKEQDSVEPEGLFEWKVGESPLDELFELAGIPARWA